MILKLETLKPKLFFYDTIGDIKKYCIFAPLFKTKRCDGNRERLKGERFQSKWIIFRHDKSKTIL